LLQHCMIVGEVIDTIFPPHIRAPVLRAPCYITPLSPLPSPFSPLRSAVFPSSRSMC
jgi:hypothetical protein